MKLTSTRQAIHDALAWGYTQKGESGLVEYLIYQTRVQKSGYVKDHNDDFLEAGFICAAINALEYHIRGWLKFAYGPNDLKVTQTALASKLRFDLFPMATVAKHNRWLALTETCLEGYRLRVHCERDVPIQLYAERMDINPTHWARDWKPHQDRVQGVIKRWDSEGVGQVSRMVQALRGRLDDETPSTVLAHLTNGE